MIVIYHNPECGTSRNTLEIIKKAGYQPIVIEYIKVGWTRDQLLSLFSLAGLTPQSALRIAKSPAKELGLLEENVSDGDILNAMLDHPILVNRPIVSTPKGVKLCRPSEIVLDLLGQWPVGPLYKEDGVMIPDADGKRLS